MYPVSRREWNPSPCRCPAGRRSTSGRKAALQLFSAAVCCGRLGGSPGDIRRREAVGLHDLLPGGGLLELHQLGIEGVAQALRVVAEVEAAPAALGLAVDHRVGEIA